MEKRVAVLLAGGKATRAKGANKAKFLLGEQTLLEHFLEELQEYEIRIAGPVERFCGLEDLVVPDRYEAGPLGAIVGVLERFDTDWVLFAACDMPYLSREMAEILYENRAGADGVCFLDEAGRVQPLFVLLSKKCLPVLRERMTAGEWSLRRCYEKLNIRMLSGEAYGMTGKVFENWNTEHEERKDFP